MAQEYLPASVRERIQDLMKERKVTQADLAKQAGCNESTLSRFLSGKTDKLSDDSIIAISGVFNVTTDFLLGQTNIPNRINYDLEELGMSAAAGKALYTNKEAAIVVNAMLESKSFPTLAHLIYQYMEGTSAEGNAAKNKLYTMLAAMTAGKNSEVANAILSEREPLYQADMAQIDSLFKRVLSEIKQDHTEKLADARKLTGDVMKQVIANLPKGTNLIDLTQEDVVNAVVATVAGSELYSQEQLDGLKKGLLPLFLAVPEKDNNVDE